MDTLKIGSINVKDSLINSRGGLKKDGTSNAQTLADIIKKNEFDFIGTQELTVKYVNELALRLNNYKFYGNYRYGSLKIIPYNENNNIITNKEVLSENTIYLPWIADNISDFRMSVTKMSIMPRIATVITTADEKIGKICMINTHLDYQIPSIQKRQLEAIKRIVLKYSSDYQIIVTGDFNMDLSSVDFQNFISQLDTNNIRRVPIDKNTWYDKNGKGKVLDHIFLPKDWDIINSGVIDLKDTSDHKGVFVKVKVK